MNSNSTLPLESQIEAVLFYLAEPTSLADLVKLLKSDQEKVLAALATLKITLETRGLALMEINDKFVLTTAPTVSHLIEDLIKEELNRDLGKASLETLAIILYQGPISRSRIDYIRGVNSGYIVRHLLTRGLIAKSDRQTERSTVYEATPELLAHLGLTSLEALPDREAVLAKIASFETEKSAETDSTTI